MMRYAKKNQVYQSDIEEMLEIFNMADAENGITDNNRIIWKSMTRDLQHKGFKSHYVYQYKVNGEWIECGEIYRCTECGEVFLVLSEETEYPENCEYCDAIFS